MQVVGLNPLRLVELTVALTNAVHAGQLLLQGRAKTPGDPELFGLGSLTAPRAQELRQAGERLARLPVEQVVAWAHGRGGVEAGMLVAKLGGQALASHPRLPLNAFRTWLESGGPGRDEASVRAVANLVQLCLEVNRDGDWLQDLIRVYMALGLKVCLSDFGISAKHADLEKIGRELAPLAGVCPFSARPLDWHMILHKLEMWAAKTSGRRDKFVLACELLQDSEIKPLLPKLQALQPRRVGIIGHSMTMSLHWATAGSWIEIACELVRQINPGFAYQGFQQGGVDAVRAEAGLLPGALQWKPTDTYLLMVVGTPEHFVAYERMIRALQAAGSRVNCVDDVRPFLDDPLIAAAVENIPGICRRTGARALAFNELGKRASDWTTWQAMGGDIHSVTACHVFYAKELLKLWAAE